MDKEANGNKEKIESLQCLTCRVLDAPFPFPETSDVTFSGILTEMTSVSVRIWTV